MSKHEQAEECIKNALKVDVKSALCWYVYSVICRTKYEYEDALKCLKNSVFKFNSNDIVALRDLSFCAFQLGYLDIAFESVVKLFNLSPDNNLHWNILLKLLAKLEEYETALNFFDYFLSYFTFDVYANHELLHFKCFLLCKAKNYKVLLENLEKHIEFFNTPQEKFYYCYCYIEFNDLKLTKNENLKKSIEKMLLELIEISFNLEHVVRLYSKLNQYSFPEDSYIIYQTLQSFQNISISVNLKVFFSEYLAHKPKIQIFNELFSYSCEKCSFSFLSPSFFKKIKISLESALHIIEESRFSENEQSKFAKASLFYANCRYETAFQYCPIECFKNTDMALLFVKICLKCRKFDLGLDILFKMHELDKNDRYINFRIVKTYIKAGKIIEAISFFESNVIFKSIANNENTQVPVLHCLLGEAYLISRDFENASRKFSFVTDLFKQFNNDLFDFYHFAAKRQSFLPHINSLSYKESIYNNKYFIRSVYNYLRVIIITNSLNLSSIFLCSVSLSILPLFIELVDASSEVFRNSLVKLFYLKTKLILLRLILSFCNLKIDQKLLMKKMRELI